MSLKEAFHYHGKAHNKEEEEEGKEEEAVDSDPLNCDVLVQYTLLYPDRARDMDFYAWLMAKDTSRHWHWEPTIAELNNYWIEFTRTSQTDNIPHKSSITTPGGGKELLGSNDELADTSWHAPTRRAPTAIGMAAAAWFEALPPGTPLFPSPSPPVPDACSNDAKHLTLEQMKSDEGFYEWRVAHNLYDAENPSPRSLGYYWSRYLNAGGDTEDDAFNVLYGPDVQSSVLDSYEEDLTQPMDGWDDTPSLSGSTHPSQATTEPDGANSATSEEF